MVAGACLRKLCKALLPWAAGPLGRLAIRGWDPAEMGENHGKIMGKYVKDVEPPLFSPTTGAGTSILQHVIAGKINYEYL